jgi:hypothetical protein
MQCDAPHNEWLDTLVTHCILRPRIIDPSSSDRSSSLVAHFLIVCDDVISASRDEDNCAIGTPCLADSSSAPVSWLRHMTSVLLAGMMQSSGYSAIYWKSRRILGASSPRSDVSD